MGSLRDVFASPLALHRVFKHYGPGPHPSGSEQEAHTGDDARVEPDAGTSGLPEKIIEIEAGERNNPRPMTIVRNPTPETLAKMAREFLDDDNWSGAKGKAEFRFLVNATRNGALYWWSAPDGTHRDGMTALRDHEKLSVAEIEGIALTQRSGQVVVLDLYINSSKPAEQLEALDALKANPALQKVAGFEIDVRVSGFPAGSTWRLGPENRFHEYQKHYGPGEHPSGSEQEAHGGGGGDPREEKPEKYTVPGKERFKQVTVIKNPTKGMIKSLSDEYRRREDMSEGELRFLLDKKAKGPMYVWDAEKALHDGVMFSLLQRGVLDDAYLSNQIEGHLYVKPNGSVFAVDLPVTTGTPKQAVTAVIEHPVLRAAAGFQVRIDSWHQEKSTRYSVRWSPSTGVVEEIPWMKHEGPGEHPGTGTPQQVHAGGGGARVSGDSSVAPRPDKVKRYGSMIDAQRDVIPIEFMIRLGNCYVLAGEKAVHRSKGGRLVHGIIINPGNPEESVAHGWVTYHKGQVVWEPITNLYYHREDFEHIFGGQEWVSYTRTEAHRELEKSGHYGPWDEKSNAWYKWKERELGLAPGAFEYPRKPGGTKK